VPAGTSPYSAATTARTARARSGATKANNGVIRLATDGSGTIRARNNSPAPLDLIIDVSGYNK
jgi:hypothetical protein